MNKLTSCMVALICAMGFGISAQAAAQDAAQVSSCSGGQLTSYTEYEILEFGDKACHDIGGPGCVGGYVYNSTWPSHSIQCQKDQSSESDGCTNEDYCAAPPPPRT